MDIGAAGQGSGKAAAALALAAGMLAAWAGDAAPGAPAGLRAQAAVTTPSATALMDWAERSYPQFFPGPQADRQLPPYTYRHYPATGNYLGVAGTSVYVLGPVAGSDSTPLYVGELAGFACQVTPASCGPARTSPPRLAVDGYAMAVKADGSVWAWGENTVGNFGDGSAWPRTAFAPQQVAPPGSAVGVAVGGHTLLLTRDGRVRAAGENAHGPLGNGLPVGLADRFIDTTVIDQVALIAATNGTSAAIRTDGSVWRWGYNHGATTQDATTSAVRVGDISDAVALATGDRSVLVLRGDGTVWFWGRDEHALSGGALPRGTGLSGAAPVAIPGLQGVSAVTVGSTHALALMADGTVRSWGQNDFGQLGYATAGVDGSVPTQVPGVVDAVAVSAGTKHSLALHRDGTVSGWGMGINTCQALPVHQPPARVPGLGADTVGVAASAGGAYFIQSDGSVRVCGGHLVGHLGLGEFERVIVVPTPIPGLNLN